jgi:hypothetical protein
VALLLEATAFDTLGLSAFGFAAFGFSRLTLFFRDALAAVTFPVGFAADLDFRAGSTLDSDVRAGFDLALRLGSPFALVFRFFFGSTLDSSAGLAAAARLRRGCSAGASSGSGRSIFRRRAGFGSAVLAAAMCSASGLRIMVGSYTLRTQPKVRASAMSLSTDARLRPFSSRITHTTFDSFVFTHLARLCRFSSAASDSVSPMQDAAWLT